MFFWKLAYDVGMMSINATAKIPRVIKVEMITKSKVTNDHNVIK